MPAGQPALWQIIEQILNDKRKRRHNLRDVIDCILEILRTGTQWRNLRHPRLGWQIVYYYFRKWRFDGTLERLNSELNKIERRRQGKKETPSLLCIDSQSVKLAPFMNRERGTDGNKKVNAGRPLRFVR